MRHNDTFNTQNLQYSRLFTKANLLNTKSISITAARQNQASLRPTYLCTCVTTYYVVNGMLNVSRPCSYTHNIHFYYFTLPRRSNLSKTSNKHLSAKSFKWANHQNSGKVAPPTTKTTPNANSLAYFFSFSLGFLTALCLVCFSTKRDN